MNPSDRDLADKHALLAYHLGVAQRRVQDRHVWHSWIDEAHDDKVVGLSNRFPHYSTDLRPVFSIAGHVQRYLSLYAEMAGH